MATYKGICLVVSVKCTENSQRPHVILNPVFKISLKSMLIVTNSVKGKYFQLDDLARPGAQQKVFPPPPPPPTTTKIFFITP